MINIKLAFCILIGLIVMSCSKNETNQTNNGELVINGESYKLDRGFLIKDTEALFGTTFPYPDEFFIILSNGNVGLKGGGGLEYSDDIKQYITLHLKSTTDDGIKIENATYPLPTDSNFNYDNAHLLSSRFDINVVIQNGQFISSDGNGSVNMENGEVVLSQSNEDFIISFNFTNSQENIFGNYSGPLNVLN